MSMFRKVLPFHKDFSVSSATYRCFSNSLKPVLNIIANILERDTHIMIWGTPVNSYYGDIEKKKKKNLKQ